MFAAACGKSGTSTTAGLPKAEFERLITLNKLQQENIDAREYAHQNLVALAVNEKSKAMGEKLARPNCVMEGSIPKDELNGAKHESSLSGADCPVDWYRHREWSIVNKMMVYTDRLLIKDEKYRKDFSPMSVRGLHGSYGIIVESTGHRIYGTIEFTEFQTTEFGRIEGAIVVDYRKKGYDGDGTVTVTLRGRGWSGDGGIYWTVRRAGAPSIIYRINGKKVDQAQFAQVFSSYELDKYMDNALKMK